MRLHRLEVSAFGPFPDRESVDFDELNEAGLFLLTGPTGAGKSSILDAICFALYGQVPGARGTKALKSQHAPGDARPEVVLDLSIHERRFVVRRSPEWSRPKKRGTGTTEEKASVTLLETTGGREHLLSSRAQEVGLLLTELLGMHAAQFQQVAMLPQGEFQVFLRATSQDRHDVLQRLFRTDRFSRIEEWVADHSRTLRERSAEGQSTVQRILDTLADRAGVELPRSDPHEPGDAPEEKAVRWAQTLRDEAVAALSVARAARDDAETMRDAAREDCDEQLRLAALLSRRDHAYETLRSLDTSEETEAEARASLDADGRAGRCSAVLALLDDATSDSERASLAHQAATEALPTPSGPSDLYGLPPAEIERLMRERITVLEALLPRERAREAARRALADATVRQQTTAATAEVIRDQQRRLPAKREALKAELEVATAAAGRVEALRLRLGSAQARLTAAGRAPSLARALETRREEERDLRDRAADARQRMQDLVAGRLAGIAAELAGRLEDGAACQVCGSTVHPHPAAASPEAVTDAMQAAATREYDERSAEHAAAVTATSLAERKLENALLSCEGMSLPEATGRFDELETRLAEAEEATALADRLTSDLRKVDDELTAGMSALHELEKEAAAVAQVVEGHRRTIEEISVQLAEALGPDDEGRPLDAVLDDLHLALDTVIRAASTSVAHQDTQRRLRELTEQAEALVTRHGFDTVTQARAAVLSSREADRLRHLVDERRVVRSRAEMVLTDPDIAALKGELSDPGRLDPAAAALRLDEAETQCRAATRLVHQREETAAALEAGLARLREAVTIWAPVREECERADEMSKLVRGIGADNHVQMRLSAYVLATRLDQVVEAANERLAHLRDQRYLLRRTGRAVRKGSQAGLGLEIIDEWTGDVRDPSTLSGGETFVVSLSLALGLADVVTQEAGGTEIETLFIDEGFGMLDPDTLDDVMDRLDGLRAGGRTVGVVSHVAEMRNRILAQVHVDKHRDGSSISVRTLVA